MRVGGPALRHATRNRTPTWGPGPHADHPFAPKGAIWYIWHDGFPEPASVDAKRNCMNKKKLRRAPEAVSFAQARDEMFSHILRCGVIEALPEHQ